MAPLSNLSVAPPPTYSGAATDAEAQANLRSRFVQDELAHQAAQSSLRAAEIYRSMQPQGPTFNIPVDNSQRDAYLQKADALLKQAESTHGFGARSRIAGLTTMAEAYRGMAGDLGQQNAALGVAQTKSLSDLADKGMTPYQAQSLDIERQKLGALQGQQAQSQRLKSLEDLRQGLYGSKEWQQYSAARPLVQNLEQLAKQDNAAAGQAFITGSAKIKDPTSVVQPSEYGVVAKSSGGLMDRMAGTMRNWFGYSPLTPGVTQNLQAANRTQAQGWENSAMNRIQALEAEAAQRGVGLDEVLSPEDHAAYMKWKQG